MKYWDAGKVQTDGAGMALDPHNFSWVFLLPSKDQSSYFAADACSFHAHCHSANSTMPLRALVCQSQQDPQNIHENRKTGEEWNI